MALALNTIALAAFVLAAVSYLRWYYAALATAGVLLFPVLAAAVVDSWWHVSPIVGTIVLLFTVCIPLLTLVLYAIDVTLAPFCIEMTYLTFLCWLLCPLGIAANYLGIVIGAVLPRVA